MAVAARGSPRKVFAETLRVAQMGTREAQYEVALMYANGVGVAKSLPKAIEWLSKAAQRGLPAAQYLLATRYASGIAVAQDERAALWWCLQAASQGHAKAQHKLGQLLAQPHPQAARQALRSAAGQGLAEAQHALAQDLAAQADSPADWAEVAYWHQRAAEQGLAAAQCALGELHARGQGVHASQEQGLLWLRKAARQNFPRAQLLLEQLLPRSGRRPQRRLRASAAERRQAADRWLQAAEAADADGKYCVGRMYQFGLGVAPDATVAQAQYLAAARLGHAQAQAALAALLEPHDPLGARGWFERAAASGVPEARQALARSLGSGQPLQAHLQALVWQVQAAQAGLAEAQLGLCAWLQSDHAVLQAGLLEQAAQGLAPPDGAAIAVPNASQAQAWYQWGSCLHEGRGVAPNRALALQLWEQAAKAGHVAAAGALGAALLEQPGTPQRAGAAEPWLLQAAQAGDAQAQWNLGGLYLRGLDQGQADAAAAMHWCHRSAEQGFAPAQATLGVLLERAGNPAAAQHWLERAAEAGDPEAQYNLGLLYRAGKGVEQDLAQAFAWFCRAAEQGVGRAQLKLGVAYGAGEGVVEDPLEAHKWLWLAQRAGVALADVNLAYSRSRLQPAQMAEAERRAQAWLERRAGRGLGPVISGQGLRNQ